MTTDRTCDHMHQHIRGLLDAALEITPAVGEWSR